MALTIPFLFLSLYFLQKLYLRTSRQIRFLDLEAKSPLYTHFVETLDGLIHIRAFRWQDSFLARHHERLDASQRPYYLMFCIQRWLNLALGFLVGAMAVVVIALAIAIRSATGSGQLGVALNSVLALDSNFQYLMQWWTTLETSLGAIARTRDFERDTPCEDKPEQETATPAADWASSGQIELEDVSATYGYAPVQPSTHSKADQNQNQ